MREKSLTYILPGFTLIELVVVLVILALLAHLAVREMGKVQFARMHRQAERQLEEIREAVWHRGGEEGASGFLVDMGRLPVARAATNETGRTVLTLSELWQRPEGVAEFALRPATSANLQVPAAEKTALADETVVVGCGWRGPYLRMPFGRDRLLDSWGNPFETPDDAGFARLTVTNGVVYGVRHLGADGRPDDRVTPGVPADRDGRVELAPPGGMAGALAVNVNLVNASGPVGVDGEVRCRWYMPCGGAITGAVAKVELSGSSFAAFNFLGLPPGNCLVAVDVGGKTCARERVVLPPGGRELQLKVWVR